MEAVRGYCVVAGKGGKEIGRAFTGREARAEQWKWIKEHRTELENAFIYAAIVGIYFGLPTCPVGGVGIEYVVDTTYDELDIDEEDRSPWKGKGPGGFNHSCLAMGLKLT